MIKARSSAEDNFQQNMTAERQKEKRAAEDEMVRQRHQLNEHVSEHSPGESGGQGSPVCCSSWGRKELDNLATEQQQQWRHYCFRLY